MLILVGAPGSGKTTIGLAVAERLGVPFVDTDGVVEQVTGSTLADLYIDSGPQEVRSFERAALERAMTVQDAVVALGSGALEDPVTADLVTRADAVVWLQVTSPNAVSRVGMNVARPVSLGNVRAQFAALLSQREPLYAQVASSAVTTDHRPIDDIVGDVIAAMPGTSHV